MLQRGSLPGKPTKPTPKQPKAPAVEPSSIKPAPSKVQDVKQQQRQRPSSSPAVSSEVQPRRPPYTKAPQVPRRPIKPPTEEVITNNYAKPAVERSSRGNLRFDGEVRFARDNREASAWLSELLKAADASSRPIMLGFDSETPVVWVKKPDGTFTTRQEQVALLQLCYHKPNQVWPVCLLLQLSLLGFKDKPIKPLLELLEHPNIIKVGMGIACDMHDLQRDYSSVAAFQPAGMLDLHLLASACGVYRPPSDAVLKDERAKQALAIKTFNRRDQWGLAGLLQHMTGHSLLKERKVTQSNWARTPLTQKQLEYATADAFASLVCCTALNVHFLQQQSAQLVQHQLLAEPYGLDAQQLPQQEEQTLAVNPVQMALWEVSKGGSGKFRKLARDAEQPWQQLLQRCCKATARQLSQTQENVRQRAEDADLLDWHLGYYYEPTSARSGYLEDHSSRRYS